MRSDYARSVVLLNLSNQPFLSMHLVLFSVLFVVAKCNALNSSDSYCDKLLSYHEQNIAEGKICTSPFNSTKGFKMSAETLPTYELLNFIGFDKNLHPLFMGAGQQDWWVCLRPLSLLHTSVDHFIIHWETPARSAVWTVN